MKITKITDKVLEDTFSKGVVPLFHVCLVPRGDTYNLMFIAEEGLRVALKHKVDIKRYVVEKIDQMEAFSNVGEIFIDNTKEENDA